MADRNAGAFQRVHDLRLVWPPEIQGLGALPGNRIGAQVYSAAQLKTIQEVITLLVFSGFSVFWLKESLTINHFLGFAMIAGGAALIFRA